jgi:predicted HTH transcriptional regulator
MLTIDINSVVFEDIKRLKDNSVPESKTLEYKKDLTLKNDYNKKEFLSDISAFANTSGGDIIYGIKEL